MANRQMKSKNPIYVGGWPHPGGRSAGCVGHLGLLAPSRRSLRRVWFGFLLLFWFASSADTWFAFLLLHALGPLLILVPNSLLLSDSHPLLTLGSVPAAL